MSKNKSLIPVLNELAMAPFDSPLFPIVPKMREKLTKANNVIKQIAGTCYFIDTTGTVIPLGDVHEIGFHYSHIGEVWDVICPMLHLDNTHASGILLYPEQYFEAQRDHKTKIKASAIVNNVVVLTDNDGWIFPIGMLIDRHAIDRMEWDALGDLARVEKYEYFKTTSDTVELDGDEMDQLKNNEAVLIEHGKFQIRIAKRTCPYFNADSTIRITFEPHPDNPFWFNAIVQMNRDHVANTHVYTCLYQRQ